MAADKGTQEAIKKLVAARPRELLNIIDGDMVLQQNFMGTREPLVKGLRFLVEDFRQQANLVMESGARGKGADATALRSTASTLSLLADAVANVDIECEGMAPPPAGRTREQVVESAGLDEAVHGFEPSAGGKCGALIQREGISAVCGRYASHPAHRSTGSLGTGTPEGLAVLVTERAAAQQPAPADERAALAAYLKGETNTMPEFTGFADPGPSTVTNAGPPGEWPEHVTQRGPVTDPEILKAAKVLEPATAVVFAEPAAAPRTGDPVMPGRRLTFAELRVRPPVEPVPHTSNSQVTQMNDCGLQARLSRYEPGVIERPQWHLVGGKALHRAAETFERALLADQLPVASDHAEALWQDAFNAEIIAQVLACPQVPQDDWRASGRGGSEGYTWWLTQGPDMVKRYLDLRLAELDRAMLMLPDGTPVLELEGVLDVEGTLHKVVIDQAWRWGPNDIVIDDLKSGANAPRGGTFQPAQYAWFMHKVLGYGTGGSKIYGRYWDARKGTYSTPVDLLELHPWDEIVWRIKDTQVKKDLGLFGPNPGPFCGGCAVKHACPVVSRG